MFFNDSSADMLNAIRGRANWWAAPLADIASWLESLPPYTREAHRALFQAMGSPWDGVSDITFSGKVDDEECLTAATVSDLLTRLEEELPSQLGIAHQTFGPDNVRCLTNWENSDWGFCIDINVNGVIVPIAIKGTCLKKGGNDVCSYVIGHILKILRHMVRYDAYWHAKDLKMRQAMEKAATLMGPGSTPLWLRRQAIAFDTPASYFRVVPYVMAFAMLDNCLHWSFEGHDRCWHPKMVKQIAQQCSALQTRRAEVRDALEQNGGYAFVTDFATDLIKDMGLDYKTVVKATYESSLKSRFERLEYYHKGAKIEFVCRDGVFDAIVKSDQFSCDHGKMLLPLDTPVINLVGRSGSPMRYLLDFPVFENVGCTIGPISITNQVELDYAVEPVMLAA